jgi:Rne/Rng family ribonuclease
MVSMPQRIDGGEYLTVAEAVGVMGCTEGWVRMLLGTGRLAGKRFGARAWMIPLEAAREVVRQLRLRDLGGIIVIDFVDMEIKENRDKVVKAFRAALARDKTRTQVFNISELGLVEMTMPDKPRSSKQRYRRTAAGAAWSTGRGE